MHMHTTFTFQIDLTSREFDLVTKGLCQTLNPEAEHDGRLQRKIRDDVPEALVLAEKLMKGRVREAESQTNTAEEKMRSAEEALAKSEKGHEIEPTH